MATQTLYSQLKQANSEEDVKDIYIKTLDLTGYTKGLIDIRTNEIWFEAKIGGGHSFYEMFTQLLHYVQIALNRGDKLPPLLAVIDTEKAALMKTSDALAFLEKKTIKWGKSASHYSKDALNEISAYIGAYFVPFHLITHEQEFIETVKTAIKTGEILARQITPDNLKQVFDKWVLMVGRNLKNADEQDYNVLFFADIMHDGFMATYEFPIKLCFENRNDSVPLFRMPNKICEVKDKSSYRKFWTLYQRPPKEKYCHDLLERRDSLIPLNERAFKGAFYTPLNVVDKAYQKLDELLGTHWQTDYIIWDMCCGVGNLEVKHNYPRLLFMSTLDQADLDIMNANKTCLSAYRFQYDYLNDDITENGKIDYNLTNKVPIELRQAIKENKKILVLINPPYAEAGSTLGKEAKNKVSANNFSKTAMAHYGKASNELFAQFIGRIAQEMPTATLAMFSTMKYVNSQNFEKFREVWNAQYLGGFVVPSKTFDGLKGHFPIGFLVWKTNQNAKKKTPITQIITDVFDKKVQPIGEKRFYNLPNNTFLNVWLPRPKPNNVQVMPLKNAISPYSSAKYLDKWADDAIGYMWCQNNDPQHTLQQTALFSSVWGDGHGFYLSVENLWQAAVVFSVRQLIKHTWINHNDQFLQPTEPLSDEFKNDCLCYMLFHGKNLTASANDLEWNNKQWSLTNHFIPFTEKEVNANGRFESDFMVRYLKDKELSKESIAVLNAGRELWQAYFAQTDDYKTQEELKLNRPDVGWYQIRNALKKRIETPVDFTEFETAYKILTAKLQPLVFELGFLRA